MTNPTAIIIATVYTFFKNVFTGWYKLTDATINGDGFTVNFYRYGTPTIDRNCDALNGWHTYWEDSYKCELITAEGTETAYFNGKQADFIFNHLKDTKDMDFGEEGILKACDGARAAFIGFKNFIG